VWCLNQTIARALLDEKKTQTQPVSGSLVLLPPPRDRHASFTFKKAGLLKDAQYQGMWRCGKIHGQYALRSLITTHNVTLHSVQLRLHPLTFTLPHLNSDVGLEEGEY